MYREQFGGSWEQLGGSWGDLSSARPAKSAQIELHLDTLAVRLGTDDLFQQTPKRVAFKTHYRQALEQVGTGRIAALGVLPDLHKHARRHEGEARLLRFAHFLCRCHELY
jgi:hypothetical protein